jgi:hypothetical protein
MALSGRGSGPRIFNIDLLHDKGWAVFMLVVCSLSKFIMKL